MGRVGVGHAEGKMEEEFCVPGWSLRSAYQRSESYIHMFSDDTDLAPLLSTFQLCSLPFSHPNSCFYFLEAGGSSWRMECAYTSLSCPPTHNTAVFTVVSGLYFCVWYDGHSMFLHWLIISVWIASVFHPFTAFPSTLPFTNLCSLSHCKCKPTPLTLKGVPPSSFSLPPFLFTCIFCLLRAWVF